MAWSEAARIASLETRRRNRKLSAEEKRLRSLWDKLTRSSDAPEEVQEIAESARVNLLDTYNEGQAHLAEPSLYGFRPSVEGLKFWQSDIAMLLSSNQYKPETKRWFSSRGVEW